MPRPPARFRYSKLLYSSLNVNSILTKIVAYFFVLFLLFQCELCGVYILPIVHEDCTVLYWYDLRLFHVTETRTKPGKKGCKLIVFLLFYCNYVKFMLS